MAQQGVQDIKTNLGELLTTYLENSIKLIPEQDVNTIWSDFQKECGEKNIKWAIEKFIKELYKVRKNTDENKEKDDYTTETTKQLYKQLLSMPDNINAYDLEETKITKIANQEGVILKTENEINERWYEYFNELLNKNISFKKRKEIPATKADEPIPEIKHEEVKKIIANLKASIAFGPDKLPAQIWKHLGDAGSLWLTDLFNKIIKTNELPESWYHSYLIPVYKGKGGDDSNCDNYRGIMLFSQTFKILEKIIRNRILKIISITDNQYGCNKNISKDDAIQKIKKMIMKHQADRKNLHLLFLDVEKAYDSVSHDLIWQAARKQSIPEAYITFLKKLYAECTTSIINTSDDEIKIKIGVGVPQGSVLSPTLFIMVMDDISRSIQKKNPNCILYADDIVLAANEINELQKMLYQWKNVLEKRGGFRINKRKIIHMPCEVEDPSVSFDGAPVTKKCRNRYLGTWL